MEGQTGEDESQNAGGDCRGVWSPAGYQQHSQQQQQQPPQRSAGGRRVPQQPGPNRELPAALVPGGSVLLRYLSEGGSAPYKGTRGEQPEENLVPAGEGSVRVPGLQLRGRLRHGQGEPVTQQGQGEEQLRAQRQEGKGPDREEEAEGEEEIHRCRQHTIQRGESRVFVLNLFLVLT